MDTKQGEGTHHSCPHCDMRASSKLKLRTHVKTCHTKPELRSPENRKQLKLIDGQPASPCIDNKLEDTLPEVQEMLECDLCDFDTFAEAELEVHKQEIHLVTEVTKVVFECEVCQEIFENNKTLEDHINSLHASESILSCVKCEQVFGEETELLTHIQSNHKAIRVDIDINDQNVLQCIRCEYRCKLNLLYCLTK